MPPPLCSTSHNFVELNKEKTALDTEIQELQAEVENKAIVVIALQSQLEVCLYGVIAKASFSCFLLISAGCQ